MRVEPGHRSETFGFKQSGGEGVAGENVHDAMSGRGGPHQTVWESAVTFSIWSQMLL